MDPPESFPAYTCDIQRKIITIDDGIFVLTAKIDVPDKIKAIKWVIKGSNFSLTDSTVGYKDCMIYLQNNMTLSIEATIYDNCNDVHVPIINPVTFTSTPDNRISNYFDKNAAFIKISGGFYNLGQDGVSSSSTLDSPNIARFSKFYPKDIPLFWLNKYEVTQDLWNYVMNEPVTPSFCPTCPKDNISQAEIDTFLIRLNDLTKNKYHYRLPTESEWECAATSEGTNNFNYAGSSEISIVGWYGGNSGGQIHPVGQKRANDLGIHDLSGNVSEVCIADAIGYYTYLLNNKVTRGGSYEDNFDKNNPIGPFYYPYISNWNEGVLKKIIYNYYTVFDSGGWDGTAKKGVGFRLARN